MGIFNPGLLIDFDCDHVEATTITGPGSTPVPLADVTLNVQSASNTVWLTAYVTWSADQASRNIRFSILREDGEEICFAIDRPANTGGGNQNEASFTTALTCCDENPPTGMVTYTLRANGVDLENANQSFDIITGNLTGAVINT